MLHLLGSGGMGQVFAAVHEQTGQQVALKLLSPEAAGDPQLVARFFQEAQALARLQHPGVVRILHFDRVEGTVFLAMERLEGVSLREWMQGQPVPAPLQAVLAIARQVAGIMVEVHARGIVHRDLKPENVFLCSDEAAASGHHVKLLDFGIAKLKPEVGAALATTQVHTHESALIGTYAYMAPEQFRSASTVDGRADVYSLGVLLFEMLAGRTPFVSADPVDVISAHLRDEAPPLKQLVPALPSALSAFIASMLAKDPAERPAMSDCGDVLGRSWTQEQEVCPAPGPAHFEEPARRRVDSVRETLPHEVQSRSGWLAEERALLGRHADLEAAAHAWEQARCPEEGLPMGALLAHYREGLAASLREGPLARKVSPLATRFLQTAERLERRRVWRRRGLWGASLVAGLVLFLAMLMAWQERRRADEGFQQVVEDAKDLTRDRDWKLSRLPDTLDARRKELQRTLARLLAGTREEPGTREALIDVQHRLGDLAWYDGTLAEADGFLRAALEELHAGLEARPGDGHFLHQLALNHSKRGKVALARGHWEQAAMHFSEALSLMQRSETRWESEEDRQRTLAVSYSELADLELSQGKFGTAAALYDSAIALFERNGGAYNDALLALALCSRGEVARKMAEVEVAEGRLQRALDLTQPNVKASPGDQFSRWVLTRTLVELGALQTSRGEFEAAGASYREAREHGQALRQGETPNKRYALALAQALLGSEALARKRGESQEAARLHDEGCQLVLDFLARDGEDVRFKALGCQGVGEE
ncbi:protein kinase [Myxococcus sp. RHST-1-4]|nr:protein kinase [Myxococcus sp. RHSTA-1-4]